MLFKLILLINSSSDTADLRAGSLSLTSSWGGAGGQELSGLSGDPVTDRAPIIHCRFEEHIQLPFA